MTGLNKWIRWDKDLNSASLAARDYPGTIGLEIWLEGKMNLINCLSVLGFALEPAVITIYQMYQDLKVKEPWKIFAGLELLSYTYSSQRGGSERNAGPFLDFHMISQFICILSSSPCTHNSNTNSLGTVNSRQRCFSICRTHPKENS